MDYNKEHAILMMFARDEWLDEKWLIRHAKATTDELSELISKGLLEMEEKDMSRFMSDNRYKITPLGFNYIK